MEDGIYVKALHAVENLRRVCDVAMVESEVSLIIEHASVVQRGTIIQFVEGDYIVGFWIGKSEMTDKPTCASAFISCSVEP